MKLLPEEVASNGGILTIEPDLPDDLFIACASFEPRSVFVANSLSTTYSARRAIVYVNREFLEGGSGPRTKPNLYGLIKSLARRADTVDVVEGSWLSDVEQIGALRQGLGLSVALGRQLERVTVDCSTFNREALLTLLVLLRSAWPECRLRILYSSPGNHGNWLSRGFRTIRNVMGLCGTQIASKPTVLAVLSGFEPHRTQKVIEEHEPSKVLLGVGDPPTSPEFLERNYLEHSLVLSRQDVEAFKFTAGDIEECRNQLIVLLEPYIDTANVVVAPMSTKMSTIATLLVAERYPQIQVTYCLPGEYNVQEYSTGVKALYVQEVTGTSAIRENKGST